MADFSRRTVLKMAGGASLGFGLPGRVLAILQDGTAIVQDHRVPAEKGLSAEWTKCLYARGTKEVWSGEALDAIGMPIGGIAAGQLYLCGDGTLGCWEIFNHHEFQDYGNTSYAKRVIPKNVRFGFTVEAGGKAWRLDRKGFRSVAFKGEFPIATITYHDPDSPIQAVSVVYSPFIPLNAKDSGLPATIFEITVKNVSGHVLDLDLVGFLENACSRSAESHPGDRKRFTTATVDRLDAFPSGVPVSQGSAFSDLEVQATTSRLASPRPNAPTPQYRNTSFPDSAEGLSAPILFGHSSGDPEVRGRDGHATVTVMLHGASSAKDEFLTERANPRKPIVLADFEGDTYGGWKVEGEAFGPGPAKGTLPNQNAVSGFVGKGLVNTYYKGDGTTGRLTSPEFTIERDFINFKIGGGNQPGKECVNLRVDGKVVRTSTGLNDERLLWETWGLKEFAGRKAHIEIEDTATGGWGHINVDQIEQSDRVQSRDDLNARHGDANRDTGTMALAVLADAKADDRGLYAFDQPFTGEVRTGKCRLEPGESTTVTYVLAWHFPYHPRGRQYSNWFGDAREVAEYVAGNMGRLSRDTKLWKDTYYDSTLPYWLLDRLHSTIGNLRTGTTEWWKSGRFWSWEGVVCCAGTCTHVWNYEHSMARLFPELERNVRDRQDFGVAFDEASGLVGFRSDREYAADGQCGTILKAYREHLISADAKFLRQHWPRIKKALEFLIRHDGNGDGIIEDSQPNTYDVDFFGANTFVGSLYLAALRAGEEMAKELGDSAFADQCSTIFQNGAEATMKRLWNAEYFIQQVDETKFGKYQYGPGCLADQLFGQGWAHQVSLGHIYPADKVVKGLQSVWKYNWAPDVAGQNKRWPPQRPFAVPGEAGLFTCTWPIGGREKEPVPYRDEVWTGIEYQVAGHMIWEGMVEEGLSICRGVHERYHPVKRNPYNEVECSDHYSRAMASWGVLTALCGFYYHGPAGRIGFAPRVTPDDFRAVFTTAEGWGTFSQQVSRGKQTNKLTLAWGKLRLKEIRLEAGDSQVTVLRNGRRVQAKVDRKDRAVFITLGQAIDLRPGQAVEIRIG